MLNRQTLLAGAVLLAAAATPVIAAPPIPYAGPFSTAAATYGPIIEDSSTDPGQALYGTPTPVFGSSTLVFTPTAEFQARSSNGVSSDVDDNTPIVNPYANSDGQITYLEINSTTPGGLGTVTVREILTYRLQNDALPSTSSVSASSDLLLTVLAGPGPLVGMTFPVSMDLNGAAVGEDFYLSQTTLGLQSGTIDKTYTFAVPGATQVLLTADNDLSAFSTTNSNSRISKNSFEISVTPIPEPSALLLGVGIPALLARRSRRLPA